MSLQPRRKLTPEEYIAMERESEMKSEFLNGETFLMGGASERHNLITLNIAGELRQQMKGRPCKVYSNDMRVKIRPTGLYAYPDVIGICDEARFDDEQRDTLLNPTVIVEVLSKSTEAYDRGRQIRALQKNRHAQGIPARFPGQISCRALHPPTGRKLVAFRNRRT